jgi:hypothetical protein
VNGDQVEEIAVVVASNQRKQGQGHDKDKKPENLHTAGK